MDVARLRRSGDRRSHIPETRSLEGIRARVGLRRICIILSIITLCKHQHNTSIIRIKSPGISRRGYEHITTCVSQMKMAESSSASASASAAVTMF